MPQRLAFAALALSIGLAAMSGTTRAQRWDDDGPDRRRREHWEHERWERERWERRQAYERHYPQPGFYAPPPVYYAPPCGLLPASVCTARRRLDRAVPMMMKGLAMTNRISQTLALLMTATVLGSPAWAQNPVPSAPAETNRPARGGTAPVERRIAGLQRRLKITPAQQPQWEAFAGVMRENAAHMETLQHERADKVAAMNASEDMRSYAEVARAHADDLQRLATAFDTLYAAMTPEQRAEADRTFHEFQGRRRTRTQP